MGPTTRSMIQDKTVIEGGFESITDTLDPIQKTVRTVRTLMHKWRYILYHRYVGVYRPKEIKAFWTNQNTDRKPYEGQLHVKLDPTSLPPDLFQSTIEIRLSRKPNVKLLKIHLYYTTNTILIQGRACRDWVEREFNRLCATVHTMAPSAYSTHCLALPNSPTVDIAVSTTCVSSARADGSMSLTHTRLQPLSLFSPSPEQHSTHGNDHSPLSPTLSDPVSVSSDIESEETSERMADDFDFDSALDQSLDRALEHSADYSVVTSEECKQNSEFLVTDNANATNSNASASAVIESQINITTDHRCCHTDCVPMADYQTTVQCLQSEISALRSALQEARQTFKIEVDSLRTKLTHLESVSFKPLQRTTSSKSKTGQSSARSPKQPKQPAASSSPDHNPLHLPSPPQDPEPSLSLPSTPSLAETTEPKTNTGPSNPLSHVVVADDTTCILLGDSVVRKIDLSQSVFPSGKPQKVCVSGLTAAGLTDWLSEQPPNNNVQQATFHVGVNDCKESSKSEASVSKRQWEGLIIQLQRVFPKASIQASLILPARGQNPLNIFIKTSNLHLQDVCKDYKIRYINHCNTFTTITGAPRKALYADSIHPSRKGTARMAENLFPRKRIPLLKTPPPLHHIKSVNVSSQQHIQRQYAQSGANACHQSKPPLLPPPLTSQQCTHRQQYTHSSDNTRHHSKPPLLPPPLTSQQHTHRQQYTHSSDNTRHQSKPSLLPPPLTKAEYPDLALPTKQHNQHTDMRTTYSQTHNYPSLQRHRPFIKQPSSQVNNHSNMSKLPPATQSLNCRKLPPTTGDEQASDHWSHAGTLAWSPQIHHGEVDGDHRTYEMTRRLITPPAAFYPGPFFPPYGFPRMWPMYPFSLPMPPSRANNMPMYMA